MLGKYILCFFFLFQIGNGCTSSHSLQSCKKTIDYKDSVLVEFGKEAFHIEGSVDSKTGKLLSTTKSFLSTDYIDVSEYKYVYYALPYSENSGIAFYDSEYNMLNGLHSVKGEMIFVKIPSGARYARFSQRLNDNMQMKVMLYKQDVRPKKRKIETDYKVVFSPKEFLFSDVDEEGKVICDPNLHVKRAPLVRIPIHIVTNDGTILVACQVIYYGKNRTTSRVFVARSTDNGNNWDKSLLYKGANPNMIYDEVNNCVFALYDDSYIYTKDNGKTWSSPLPLNIGKPKGWTGFFQSPTTGIQLKNGILATVYEAVKGEGDKIKENVNVVVFSRDFGKTWEMSPITPSNIIANEATIAEYEENQIMINSRGGTEVSWGSPNPGRRVFIPLNTLSKKKNNWNIEGWQLHSSDRKIIEPVCNASLIAIDIKRKKLGLFCNPHEKYNPRRNLVLQYSDDFVEWHESGLLTNFDQTVYGYCSLYYNRERLSFVYEDMKEGILYSDITNELKKIIERKK